MSFTFHRLKIYDGDRIIRDFIPCVNENNTISIYDNISNKSYIINGIDNYIGEEKINEECNCWRCVAERNFNAKRVHAMKIGKVYLYQLYSESFEEFCNLEEAERFRRYADENIPYWDYDPVSTIDLNDYDQVIICKHRGWIIDCER